MSHGSARVLVLGGGYAGMLAAARIAQEGRAQLTLIDKNPFFVQRIRLHEMLAGRQAPGIAYQPALARRGIGFLQRCVEGIDPNRQEVVVSASDGIGQRLGYDTLVIALGSGAS